MLSPFPLVNMAAIGGMLVPWLLVGGTLVLHQPLDLPTFLRQITTERVEYTVAPPVVLNALLLNPALLAGVDLSSLRKMGSGAAPLAPWMVKGWHEKHGIPVVNLFGSNEGASFLGDERDVPDPEERAVVFPRYGVPGLTWHVPAAAAMSTKLADPETGETITEAGRVGEMLIKGPAVFSGYYKRPDLNARAFDADGYFRTADLFAIDGAAQDRYRFVGRLGEMINRGGTKVSPEELELLLAQHPKVAEVAVVGVPDPRLGHDDIVVFAAPKPEQSITLAELLEFLRAQAIAPYKMPRALEVLPKLPRNAVGKVLKRELKRSLLERRPTWPAPA
jgi:acyl-CoA synthetase (AMP-forming)/AMP-acid ligase II